MTYPTKPPVAYDYVTFQAGNPTDPLPANEVAADFADHKTSIDAIVEFSKLVQRSDGNLRNASVRLETLDPLVQAAIGTVPSLPAVDATAFGVTIGTTVDQSVDLQRAIDYAELHKLRLSLPAGYIRIDNTIFLGVNNSVWVEGQQPHAFFGFSVNAIDNVTVLYCANLPSNVPAVTLTASSDTRDGITLKNMTIYRPTPSTAGAGDTGVMIVSATKPLIEDLVIYGFDTGIRFGGVTATARSTYLGNFRNIRVDQSGNYGGLVDSCVDCLFDHCWFGGATIASFAIQAPPTGVVQTNGNYFEHCTFIASTGTTPINSCRVDVGFWNSFTTCAFEQASGENFKADYSAAGNGSGHSVDRVDVVLSNCWFNNGVASNTGNISFKDVNFEIIGGRAGSDNATGAAIKVDKSFFNITTFDSCIMGMQIEYNAVAGVSVDNVEALRVIGCSIHDHTAGGLPCVVAGSGTGRNIVTNNRFKTTHARGYTDAGELGGSGNVFTDNVLSSNVVADAYWQRSLNGPMITLTGAGTPKTQEHSTSQATSSRLYSRYTNDTGGVFHYWYKTRQTVPGGARAAASSGDSVSLRRFYADDGTADQEVFRETVNVDGVTGGSWSLASKIAAGSLTTRITLDNAGVWTVSGIWGFTGPSTITGNQVVTGNQTVGGNVNTTAGTVQAVGSAGGTADALTATPSPALTAYGTLAFYLVKATATNATTTPTINISGLGAKTIVKRAATALAAGDIVNGMILHLAYDGTNMQLLNPVVN